MPYKNGIEVVKEVTCLYEPFKDRILPKFVFVTAHGDNKAYREYCLDQGVNKVYGKPLEASQLQELQKMLNI
jgi:CheY-like chemotaxis protein